MRATDTRGSGHVLVHIMWYEEQNRKGHDLQIHEVDQVLPVS
jgi:hypothetical protein